MSNIPCGMPVFRGVVPGHSPSAREKKWHCSMFGALSVVESRVNDLFVLLLVVVLFFHRCPFTFKMYPVELNDTFFLHSLQMARAISVDFFFSFHSLEINCEVNASENL